MTSVWCWCCCRRPRRSTGGSRCCVRSSRPGIVWQPASVRGTVSRVSSRRWRVRSTAWTVFEVMPAALGPWAKAAMRTAALTLLVPAQDRDAAPTAARWRRRLDALDAGAWPAGAERLRGLDATNPAARAAHATRRGARGRIARHAGRAQAAGRRAARCRRGLAIARRGRGGLPCGAGRHPARRARARTARDVRVAWNRWGGRRPGPGRAQAERRQSLAGCGARGQPRRVAGGVPRGSRRRPCRPGRYRRACRMRCSRPCCGAPGVSLPRRPGRGPAAPGPRRVHCRAAPAPAAPAGRQGNSGETSRTRVEP